MRKGITPIKFDVTVSLLILCVYKIEFNLPSADEDHFLGFKMNVKNTNAHCIKCTHIGSLFMSASKDAIF